MKVQLACWSAVLTCVALGCADDADHGVTPSQGGGEMQGMTGGQPGGPAQMPAGPSAGQDGGGEQPTDPTPGNTGSVACSPLAESQLTKAPVSGELPTFEQHTISEQPGAAFLHATDLNGDEYPEFLLTTLLEDIDILELPGTIFGGIFGNASAPVSPGGAYILRHEGGPPTGSLDGWVTQKVFDKSADVEWPNESEVFDVDNDGVKDWVIGAGFLARPTGAIVWMKGSEGEGGLSFSNTPQRLQIPDTDYWYHSAKPLDVDGDGDTDFITTSHKGVVGDDTSRLEWFENDGVAGEASFTYHLIAENAGGAILELFDVDGDGDQDVLLPQFFHGQSLVWYENAAGDGSAWTSHLIDDTTGRGFAVLVADVDGDGRQDIVYTNHNHQDAEEAEDRVMGVYWWSIPDPTELETATDWSAHKHVVYEGFEAAGGPDDANSVGAPGMFNVGDIDRDGDLDISVSGDGDPGLHLFIQQAGGSFDMITLDTGHENSGSQIMADLDGDCDLDIAWAVFGPQNMSVPTSKVYAFLQQ